MKATIRTGTIEHRENGWCVVVGQKPVGFADMKNFTIREYFEREVDARAAAMSHGIYLAKVTS